MKRLFLLFFFLNILVVVSAQKYMTRNGYIGFFSHTQMEDIKGDNNQVASVMDISTGEMVFPGSCKIVSFRQSSHGRTF